MNRVIPGRSDGGHNPVQCRAVARILMMRTKELGRLSGS